VIDVIGDANAIKEAHTIGVPVVAIVDTNANPDLADYVIPGNDDAIKGIKLMLSYVAEAVKEGQKGEKSEPKDAEEK
jgi:small subunit ribosomal protein S2